MPTSVGGVNFAAPTPPQASPSNGLDRDAFLKLLVAQLRYQNPLSPADPESMLAQTAQFSTVERLEQLNQVLAESGRAQRLSTAAGLIGREVVATGPYGEPVEGRVDSVSRTADDGVVLHVGPVPVPLDAVQRVL